MSNIIGLIESAMDDADHGEETVAAIEAFLKIVAERGWRVVPDKATYEMTVAADQLRAPNAWMEDRYHAMLETAPKFKWRDE